MQTENPLGSRPLPQLLASFAIPSILAMLVSSLYNIVDQIFIGQGVGYLGNAATNVAYPLSTICLAIALLIGVGSAASFNLNLGAGRQEAARRVVGSAVTMMVVLGLAYMVVLELFAPQLLRLFGGTDSVMPYALTYTRITAVGMPLLILTNAHQQPDPCRRQPPFFHGLYAAGRHYQHDPGPGVHLPVPLGRGRRRLGHRHWAGSPPEPTQKPGGPPTGASRFCFCVTAAWGPGPCWCGPGPGR